jgi:hypothetical protein
MSTDYRPLKDILFDEVFDGRLEKYGVQEQVRPDTTERDRYLIGRDGVLVVYQNQDGTCNLRRDSFSVVPYAILDSLAEEFNTEIVTEHDHRFWGFETEEEWDAFNEKLAREHEDKFYKALLHYVRGEPHGLSPGTIGMIQADIAKTIVTREPSLMRPENRSALLAAVERIYEEEHTVKVTLTEQDLAQVAMMVTRTDDLPRS